MAERFDRDVSSAAGQFANGFDHVLDFASIDYGGCSYAPRYLKLPVVDVDRDRLGAECVSDHDRRQTDSAAAEYGDVLTSGNLSLVDHRAKGGDKSTPETRGRRKFHVIRQTHE